MEERRWARIQTRMPPELEHAVKAAVTRLGLTQAEFVREALIAYCAWHRALDAVDDGVPVEDLRDPAVVARLLGTDR